MQTKIVRPSDHPTLLTSIQQSFNWSLFPQGTGKLVGCNHMLVPIWARWRCRPENSSETRRLREVQLIPTINTIDPRMYQSNHPVKLVRVLRSTDHPGWEVLCYLHCHQGILERRKNIGDSIHCQARTRHRLWGRVSQTRCF